MALQADLTCISTPAPAFVPYALARSPLAVSSNCSLGCDGGFAVRTVALEGAPGASLRCASPAGLAIPETPLASLAAANPVGGRSRGRCSLCLQLLALLISSPGDAMALRYIALTLLPQPFHRMQQSLCGTAGILVVRCFFFA